MGLFSRFFKKENKNTDINGNINQANYNKNDYLHSLKYTPISAEQNPDMLEYDIQKWITRFFNNNHEYSSLSAKSYACLVSCDNMITDKDMYTNLKNEDLLNQYIDNVNVSSPFQYERIPTFTPSGEISFNFIATESGKQIDSKHRLYINCDHKNTTRIVYEILKQCSPEEKIQLKYVSGIQKKERNEKIVIYTDNENDLNTMFGRINNVYKSHPNFFNNSRNLPFMKNLLPGVGYGSQPTDKYINLNNQYDENIAQSFNSFVSEMLLESLLDTIDKICAVDNDVKTYIPKNGLNLNIYRYMDDKYHKSFMQNMVDKVLLLSEKNNLDIKRAHNQNLPRYNNKNKVNSDKYLNPNNESIDI